MTILTGQPVKRRRRTKAQVEQLHGQIYEVLAADHPQSVRHVFYRMTDPRLPEPVEKTEHGYNQLQQQVVNLRRAGVIPYSWISDTTRRGYHVDTFHDAEDFIRNVAGLYRADLWSMSEHYVEVWCESRSIAGVIQADCKELAVSLYPSGRFASLTLAYEAADYIGSRCDDGTPAEIIYIGDYGPAGVLIDRAIESEIRNHLSGTWIPVNFHRIAINPDQIVEHDLPVKPRKDGDRRARHITGTVEAEAMPAHLMRRILREKVESFLPPDALRVAKIAEANERFNLTKMAEGA